MQSLELQAQQAEGLPRAAPSSAPERAAASPSPALRQVADISAGYKHEHTAVDMLQIDAGITPE